MPETENDAKAEVAWLAYRDQYQRERPWCEPRRAARQMRKRDFIAGYLAALPACTEWWISDGDANHGGRKILGPFATRDLALDVRSLYEASPRANGLTFWVSEVPSSPASDGGDR